MALLCHQVSDSDICISPSDQHVSDLPVANISVSSRQDSIKYVLLSMKDFYLTATNIITT